MKNILRINIFISAFFIFLSIGLDAVSQAVANQINWFNGTIGKALEKKDSKWFISDLQILKAAEKAKNNGIDPVYVDSKIIDVLQKRAEDIGPEYWKKLFDQIIKQPLYKENGKFRISDQLILDTAKIAKQQGLDDKYVDKIVQDVLYKRANIDIENLKNWFMGTIKAALHKDKNNKYVIIDKQINTSAQIAKDRGIDPEYVDYIVRQLFKAREQNMTIEQLQNWFDGTIRAALEKRNDKWVILDKQIKGTADLAKALGLKPEYVDDAIAEIFYQRAKPSLAVPYGPALATPVGKPYTDKALVQVGPSEMIPVAEPSLAVPYGPALATPVGKPYTENSLVQVGSSEIIPVTETSLAVPYGPALATPVGKPYTENSLVPVGSSEMIPVAERSLAVPYGSALATPVGKPYTENSLVPVGSSEMIPVGERSLAVPYGSALATPVAKPYKDQALVPVGSFKQNKFSAPQYLLTGKNVENILPEDVIIENMPTDGLALQGKTKLVRPESSKYIEKGGEEFVPSVRKTIRTLRPDEIKQLSGASRAIQSSIVEPIKFLPEIEGQTVGNLAGKFGKAGSYGAAAGLLGLGLGAAYTHREKINDMLNRLADLNDSEIAYPEDLKVSDNFQPGAVNRPNINLSQQNDGWLMQLEKINQEKEKALKEQRKYNKIKKDFNQSIKTASNNPSYNPFL